MVMITRVLCPVDFSEASKRALEYAAALARWYDAGLTVMHAAGVPAGIPVAVQAGPVVPEPPGLALARRTELRATLGRFVAPVEDGLLKIDLQVHDGYPVEEIVDLAEQAHTALIVMGTHGRKGLQRFVLGSVAEKVIRLAPCPVLIVPPRDAVRHAPPFFRRILCPLDFSTSSLAALRHACSLTPEGDSFLLLLHVLPGAVEPYGFGEPPVHTPASKNVETEQALEQLRDEVPPPFRELCTVRELVVAGNPGDEILDQAEQNAVDLIVLGVTGRGAANLALFGSTTQHVLRRASCPVLTVRGSGGESGAALSERASDP
jgi:nucleotide-binding universal stress UspA family protein